jgi:hypothetical protein
MNPRRTVAAFVEAAFPQGSIPSDADPDLDFSYNHKNYDWVKGIVSPSAKPECLEQFPPWPADLFAVAAALLETTSVYQQLANAIHPRRVIKPEAAGDYSRADWAKAVDPGALPNSEDPFGVHGADRVTLRIIGALWGHGALIASGVHIGKDRVKDPGAALSTNLERISDEKTSNVLSFIMERLGSEVRRGDWEDIVREAFRWVAGKMRFAEISSSNILQHCADVEQLSCSSISKAAVHSIARNIGQFNQTKFHGKDHNHIKRYYRDAPDHHWGDFEAVKETCLIVWACYYIQHHWTVLRTCKQPLILDYSDNVGKEQDKEWWRAAFRLLLIADEAGKGLGFSLQLNDPHHRGRVTAQRQQQLSMARQTAKAPQPPQAGRMCRSIWSSYLKRLDAKRIAKVGKVSSGLIFPRTLTRCFDDNLGAVLPKARTAQNGCTLRSLSLNFGYLPPKGRVRARWARKSHTSDSACYNILLIPYPYQIRSKYVTTSTPPDGPDDWGYFSIAPHWLYCDADNPDETLAEKYWNVLRTDMDGTPVNADPDGASKREPYHEGFWKFVSSLIGDQPAGTIDAVVFPEASLDWYTFDYVQKKILEVHPEIKMLVAGLTSRRKYNENDVDTPWRGNFVATYIRDTKDDPEDIHGSNKKTAPVWEIAHVRSKHHRWKLDTSQLLTYAFSQRLPPDRMWWEEIYLYPREMLFAEFAGGSIVTTLICEDLARIEPCQIALRSVGPNLVLVLLMDSAQVIGRWPHQYAGVLTDDPGSSILTLTSFGLVRRANFSEGKSSREIALWREPLAGRAMSVPLPPGYHAQLISLRREFQLERTLDGRGDNGDSAAIWRFAGLTPIRARKDCSPPGGGADD